jgi:protease I
MSEGEATMARRLEGLRGCMFAAEGVEDLEYFVTMMRLQEEGVQVDTVALSLESFRGKNGLVVSPDRIVADVQDFPYDVVVLPGGWAPDKLRRSPEVVRIIRSRYAAGAIIAAICHGPWLLASADLVRGRRATGSLGIKDDLVNAGAVWVDESAFIDGQLVWGRVVADIPNFCHALVERLNDYSAVGNVPD